MKKIVALSLALVLLVGGLAMFTPAFGQATTAASALAGRLYGGTGPAPTPSGCGTVIATNSTDAVGIITVASAAACTVTFATVYSAAPACVAANQTSAANYVTKVSTTTSAAVISFAAGPSASDLVSYVCVGLKP